jgi:hypothetical protein
MSHVPFIRFSRARDPDDEARSLKRRFASIWRRYERAMNQRREMRPGRAVAVFVIVAVASYAAVWVLLDLLK